MAIKHNTTVTDGVDVYNKAKWEANHVIDAETITEVLLDVLNAPTDDYALTYDSTAGRLNWEQRAKLSDIAVDGNLSAAAQDAVSKRHDAATVAGAPLTLAGQLLTFNKSASHFDLSGNDLILKSAGHGATEHNATSLDTTAKLLAQNIRPTYNRLAGVTATFSTFDTNPSNPENMTDGNWTTETGYGTKSLAGVNGTIGSIFFDMSAPYPVLIIARVNINRSSGDGTGYCTIYSKVLSGDSYQYSGYPCLGSRTTDAYYPMMPLFAYGRYLWLYFFTNSVTVNPSVFNVKVAEVMALQVF